MVYVASYGGHVFHKWIVDVEVRDISRDYFIHFVLLDHMLLSYVFGLYEIDQLFVRR
jgi:hypothetical protein